MAYDDREIELRFQLTEEQFNQLKDKVHKTAKFIRLSGQRDVYFTPAHKNFVKPKYPYEWLSIRERDELAVLNYKHFYPEEADIKTHCDEYNVEISDSVRFNKIFKSLDFKILVVVEKRRWIYEADGKYEISFDNIKDLGFFVEIEALVDFGGVEKTRKGLFDFTQGLGIDISRLEKRGYPYMLMKKKGLIK